MPVALLPSPCATRGRALEPQNPELLLRTIQLYHTAAAATTVAAAGATATPPSGPNGGAATAAGTPTDASAGGPSPPSPIVARVLAEEAEGLLGAGGLDGAVEGLIKLAEGVDTGSLGARVCAAKALVLVTVSTATAQEEEGRDRAVKIVREGLRGRGVTVAGCAAAVEVVRALVGDGDGDGAAVQELREACAKVFPIAEAFGASSAAGEVAADAAPSG